MTAAMPIEEACSILVGGMPAAVEAVAGAFRGRWLIFADWLEEQGDPRGEMIRLQVHLAELPADNPGRRALVAREFELFHTLPRGTIVLYPPRVVQILKKAGMPIEEASSILVGGMPAAVEAVGRALRLLTGFPHRYM
jgi:hypothetical protein